MLSTGNSLRESAITHSKFMRWSLGEGNREVGNGVRTEVDNWKRQRAQQLEQHKAYGGQLKQQMKDQIARDRQVLNEHKEKNLAQGKAIKAEVAALKQAKAMAKAQWEMRGKALAKKDHDQKEKIKMVRGEGSKSLNELTAKVKAEEAALAESIVNKKREILEANQREVAEIKKQTDDHVTDASKKIFYEQRKSLAENTRLAEEAWVSERNQKTGDFIAKAKANKEEAAATRARAKAIREQIVFDRQKEAAKMRKEQTEIKEILEKTAMMSATGVKGTHDKLYKEKYVSAEQAAKMAQSPYASAVA
uniref:Uncharacterized protein n=1 Tax=Prymnesium polylepis TaxID=72548 RepID=A0A7S4KG69_9EUKA